MIAGVSSPIGCPLPRVAERRRGRGHLRLPVRRLHRFVLRAASPDTGRWRYKSPRRGGRRSTGRAIGQRDAHPQFYGTAFFNKKELEEYLST